MLSGQRNDSKVRLPLVITSSTITAGFDRLLSWTAFGAGSTILKQLVSSDMERSILPAAERFSSKIDTECIQSLSRVKTNLVTDPGSARAPYKAFCRVDPIRNLSDLVGTAMGRFFALICFMQTLMLFCTDTQIQSNPY